MNIVTPNKEYYRSRSLVYSCQYHVIFCPKYRRKVLINGIDESLKELILQKQNDYKYHIIEMEVMPDHVHLLIEMNPIESPSKTISRIKGYTAHELREQYPQLKTKLPSLWTRSSFISTVGAVSLDTVKKYIEEQKNV